MALECVTIEGIVSLGCHIRSEDVNGVAIESNRITAYEAMKTS